MSDIAKVRSLDFDRLDMLVSERIAALKVYADSLSKVQDGDPAHDAICRDLVFPAVGLLVDFVQAVTIETDQAE